jgi:hypothetical protein
MMFLTRNIGHRHSLPCASAQGSTAIGTHYKFYLFIIEVITVNFKVLGFACSRTTRLKEACELLLTSLPGDHQLTCVEEAEEMKAMGVSNTPALAIDDVVLFQGCAMSAIGIRKIMEKHALISP